MKANRLLSAGFTVVGAAALLAASGILTVAVTMAALDGTWTQVIDFNDLGEGPLELALAWALLPAAGWVLRSAMENEITKLAEASDADERARRHDGEPGPARAEGQASGAGPRALGLDAIGAQPRSRSAHAPTGAHALSAQLASPSALGAQPSARSSELPAALGWARAFDGTPEAGAPSDPTDVGAPAQLSDVEDAYRLVGDEEAKPPRDRRQRRP